MSRSSTARTKITDEEIVEAYRASGNNIWVAAKQLRANGETIWRRLRRMGYQMDMSRTMANTVAETTRYPVDLRADIKLRFSHQQQIYFGCQAGHTPERIARDLRIPIERVVKVTRLHTHYLWKLLDKWRQSEVKCRALAMELRQLRAGKECQPDQPIETLFPPQAYLDLFKAVGVETVNQLRSLDPDTLRAYYKFPVAAIHWALLTLDKNGLSHGLAPKQKVAKPRKPAQKKHLVVIGNRKWWVADKEQ